MTVIGKTCRIRAWGSYPGSFSALGIFLEVARSHLWFLFSLEALDPRLGSRGRGQFWRGNQTKSQLCNHLENFNEKVISSHLPVQPSPVRGRDGGSGHDQRSPVSRPPSPPDILSNCRAVAGQGLWSSELRDLLCARAEPQEPWGAFTAAAAWGGIVPSQKRVGGGHCGGASQAA